MRTFEICMAKYQIIIIIFFQRFGEGGSEDPRTSIVFNANQYYNIISIIDKHLNRSPKQKIKYLYKTNCEMVWITLIRLSNDRYENHNNCCCLSGRIWEEVDFSKGPRKSRLLRYWWLNCILSKRRDVFGIE